MNMGKYMIRRSLYGVLAFILILLMYSIVLNTQLELVFKEQIPYWARGIMSSPAMKDDLIGKTPEEMYQIRKNIEQSLYQQYGLTGSFPKRILTKTYLALKFEFGHSSFFQTQSQSTKVRDLIFEALPNTLILFVSTTILSVFLAILVGVKKAQHVNSAFDRITSMITMFFYGMPSWLIGSFFVLFFVYYLRILPFGALYSVPPPEGELALILDRLSYMVIPVFSVVVVKFWPNAFLIKNIILGPLQEDYIASARSRGLPERRVIYGHALRSASPAILTMSVQSIITSFSGDIVLEQVLAWPGIGNLLWKATKASDFPLMMGVLTSLTLIFVIAIILLDIIYAFLDPRIQYS